MQELTAPEAVFSASADALPAALMAGPVALAVSGGSDSMALMLLAERWSRRTGHALIVCTVDHGLRLASAREAAEVAASAAALGLAHRTLVWTAPRPGAAFARRARYALLAETLRAEGGRLLLTGHTADDQAETFLIRARQGSGWHGLAGMRPLAPPPVWPEGRGVWIARPLLGARRAELKAWLAARGQAWIDDPSNADSTHERVRMRQHLADSPERVVQIGRIQSALGALRAADDARLAAWLSDDVHVKNGAAIADLSGLPAEVAARGLSILIQAVMGTEASPRGPALRRLAARLTGAAPFRGATLGGAHFRKSKECVAISREKANSQAAALGGTIDARLAMVLAVLSGRPHHFEIAAGKGSFLETSVPIL